jgi:hypothetical protein
VAAAAAEHEATVALAAALLGLGREPRPGAVDVGAVVAYAAAVFTPLLRHRGVALSVTAPDAAPTGADARAVRLAVCGALEAAWVAAAERGPPAGGGPDHPPAPLRCNLQVTDGPTLVLAPAPAAWPEGAGGVLAEAGVRVSRAPDGVRVTFPTV